jgi:hypothetical protein
MKMRGFTVCGVWLLVTAMVLALASTGQCLDRKNTYYTRWSNCGPLKDSTFFPIAVWYQPIAQATNYAAAGINIYIGPTGNTNSALGTLGTAGLYSMTDFSSSLLTVANSSRLIGWTHQDEPDNDQNGAPCIDTAIIKNMYNNWKTSDPTRPVYLNLGMGVAYTQWGGRGACTSNTRMYPGYLRGCDIPSYDIYPVVNDISGVTGSLWYVAKGIDSLRLWCNDEKPCWCWIECTHINATIMPTPAQVKTEVWMALIAEAGGFGYFCHEWSPSFAEAAWLQRYPAMTTAITAINAEIKSLAPVLNSPTVKNMATVTAANWRAKPRMMMKVQGGNTYVFMTHMANFASKDTFKITGLSSASATATVLSEGRTIPVTNGVFVDSAAAYGVHLYRISGATVNIEGHQLQAITNKLERAVRIFQNPCQAVLVVALHNDVKNDPLELAVYAMDGRRMAALVKPVNDNILSWNGRDPAGRGVPAGMYSLRATLNGVTVTKPFIFMH